MRSWAVTVSPFLRLSVTLLYPQCSPQSTSENPGFQPCCIANESGRERPYQKFQSNPGHLQGTMSVLPLPHLPACIEHPPTVTELVLEQWKQTLIKHRHDPCESEFHVPFLLFFLTTGIINQT